MYYNDIFHEVNYSHYNNESFLIHSGSCIRSYITLGKIINGHLNLEFIQILESPCSNFGFHKSQKTHNLNWNFKHLQSCNKYVKSTNI